MDVVILVLYKNYAYIFLSIDEWIKEQMNWLCSNIDFKKIKKLKILKSSASITKDTANSNTQ